MKLSKSAYRVFAGDDWPTYEEYRNDFKINNDAVRKEIEALEKNLKDKKFLRTFDTAVDNKEIKDNLLLLVNAAKLSQQKPSNTFSLAISSAQANSAQGLLLLATGYAGGSGDLGVLGTAATAGGVLLTPRALAKFATSKAVAVCGV